MHGEIMTTHKPFIAAKDIKTAEFTWRAIVLGVLLGLLFGVGNAYLGLKVGITVSASIPAAVMSMAILRSFFKRVSILENNLVQTIASVGEGLAAGIIFTVPALFLLGEPPTISRIFLLAALGGILGVLFMIPMRRYLIVKEHETLPFPEGTACAEILKSGESAASYALMTFLGIIVGSLYKLCCNVFYLFKEVPSWTIAKFQKTEFSMDCTPALLSVGFIIGPSRSGYLFAGGALAWWVLIPLIHMFGSTTLAVFPGSIPIAQMSADEIWSDYIRYIGAGAIAVGGLVSLIKIAPLIGKTLKVGFDELFQGMKLKQQSLRTDRDISLRWLILGAVAIILILWLFPGLPMNFLTIVLLVVLGFFFVAVTSLTVGIIGSSCSPVSGMTITTLLITCLVFVMLGWTERIYLIAALTMSVVANVAICLGATTSQDLKTGFLVGATPRLQQIGEIIGIFLPALAIGGTLYLLNSAYSFGSKQLPAPQGTMMAMIAKGVIQGDIPTTLVIVGAALGLLLEVLRVPILPVAIGLYLPLSLSTGIMVGGLVSAFVKKREKTGNSTNRGILAASGLIAGDACTGVIIALLAVGHLAPTSAKTFLPDWTSLAIYALLAIALGWFALKPPKRFHK